MFIEIEDAPAQGKDGHATDKRGTGADVRSDQEVCSDHVAIEAHAALEVRHRNPKVMQAGQAGTIATIVHELDRARTVPLVWHWPIGEDRVNEQGPFPRSRDCNRDDRTAGRMLKSERQPVHYITVVVRR